MENSNKILIADDDHAALASIERLLSTTIKDIEIIKADNSNAALNIILSKKPMIAVCDLHMPGGSGLDILRKVRSDSEVKDTYFILLSSTNEKENKAKAYEFGVDAYLAKPVDSNQFISKIQSALRLNKMQV